MREGQGRRVRGASREVQRAAREMRRAPTAAEEKLWSALRRRSVAGARFRRQHPLGRFVLDFYSAEQRLAIELDGGVHEDRGARDAARTEMLEAAGIRVLRFRNDEVLEGLDRVVARIRSLIEASPPADR